jgi:hypothetical protein
MKANESSLRGMAERAADLDPPQRYEEQHDVFVSAIDELREASRLAHGMAADPVAAAELGGFDEYDGRVDEASALCDDPTSCWVRITRQSRAYGR